MFVYYGISYALNGLLSRKKILLGLLAAILVYGLSLLFLYLLTYGWMRPDGIYKDYFTSSPAFHTAKFMQTYLKLTGSFSIFAFLGYLYRQRLNAFQKQQQEQFLRKQFEYETLAQQVSPHLLANVFLDLERELKTDRPDLGRDIADLYVLMRHYMSSSLPGRRSTVLLKDEIDASKKFISLQERFRARESSLIWEIRGNTNSAVIPSTGLLTLIENIFKHGDPFDPEDPPRIRVEVLRDYYQVTASNSFHGQNSESITRHGIGLKNLQKRLEFAFDENVEFGCSIRQRSFRVHFKVNL